MDTKRKRGLALLAAAAVAGVVVVLFALPRTSPVVEQSAAPVPKETTATATPPPAPIASPSAAETLSAKIERLTASGKSNPADAFAAYQIVFDCVVLERVYKLYPAPARKDDYEACNALPPSQHTDRMNNLAVALAADVPGAGLAFYQEGPIGDGAEIIHARPNDPLVIAWQEKVAGYVRRDALRGDTNAMQAMVDLNGGGFPEQRAAKPNKAEAVAWEAATWDVRLLRQPDRAVVYSRLRDESIARVSAGMQPAEVAAAKAKGAELVAQCCSTSAVAPTPGQR